ncbi:MAG: hypothetical protein IH960_12390 [Chloroflexi bacterium]|nr:hypothetical protein [Chloroflexota bacterium]
MLTASNDIAGKSIVIVDVVVDAGVAAGVGGFDKSVAVGNNPGSDVPGIGVATDTPGVDGG